MMAWRAFVARCAVGGGIIGVAVTGAIVVGMKLATADPSGPPTRRAFTYSGVLRGVAAGRRTLTFAFQKPGVPGATCGPIAVDADIQTGGAFTAPVNIGSCPNFFDGADVTYTVSDGSEVLTPDGGVAITPVPYARFADQVGVNNDCPSGYTRDSSDPTVLGGAGVILCRRGRDEVVRVGDGAEAFWIDRYEATVWSNRDGMGDRPVNSGDTDELSASFPRNGEWHSASPSGIRARSPWFAVSVRAVGFHASNYVTWFQASALCRASGKRLPSGDEWLAAAQGTPDNDSTRCAISQATPRNIDNDACYSIWGAQDMVGNLFEWTSEWYAGTIGVTYGGVECTSRVGASCASWPDDYGEDGTRNIAGGVATSGGSGYSYATPAAATRGGYFNYANLAGRFAISLEAAPSLPRFAVGFRCVVTR